MKMTICKCGSNEIYVNDKYYKYHNVYACKKCGYWTYGVLEDDCCRNSHLVITHAVRTNSTTTIKPITHLYRQCMNCYGSLNRTKPLNQKEYQSEREFYQEGFDNWLREKNEEKLRLVEDKKEYRIFSSKRQKYFDYLSSVEWREKRKLVLERDNNSCQKCKNKADDIHHLTYEHLYSEPLEDLISLCRDCHSKEHNKFSRAVGSFLPTIK